MYREPVGVVFIVLASLFSTFLVRPISSMFGLDGGQVASPEVYVLGIVGALLCIVNKPAARGISGRPPSSEVSTSSMLTPLLPVGSGEEPTCDERTEKESSMEKFSVEPAEDGGSGPIQVTNYHSIQQSQTAVAASVPSLGASATRAACWARAREVSMEMLRILLPFGLLSFVASTWFVSQKFINDDWHMNVFGYTALDQVLLPLYIFPYLWVTDQGACMKKTCQGDVDKGQTFWQAFKQSMREASFWQLFLYRLFLNARACMYFFLAVEYDLSLVFLELTLTRVVMSWIFSGLAVLVFPKFIGVSPEERKAQFVPWAIICKVIGTVAITASIILVNEQNG